MSFQIQRGLAPDHVPQAADFFWQAFKGKLGSTLGPSDKALTFLQKAISTNFALTALDGAGNLVGVAGFKTPEGSFVGGSWADMQSTYGTFGALWRSMLLGLVAGQRRRGLVDGRHIRW